jgi:hypothetical protein
MCRFKVRGFGSRKTRHPQNPTEPNDWYNRDFANSSEATHSWCCDIILSVSAKTCPLLLLLVKIAGGLFLIRNGQKIMARPETPCCWTASHSELLLQSCRWSRRLAPLP